MGIVLPSKLRSSPAVYRVTKHLAKLAIVKLDICSIYHLTYDYCLCLYNNYTQYFKELEDEDEKDVLNTIQEELKIPDDIGLMWFFQIDNNID